MAISLDNIRPKKSAKKSGKRLGRGYGSGKGGHTVGRGQKGQKSRSGASGFQRRGMRTLMLSIPKLRGFNSPEKKKTPVNLKQVEGVFIKGETVTPKALVKKDVINSARNGVKILGDGEIKTALTFKGVAVSKSAAEKILEAGGNIEA